MSAGLQQNWWATCASSAVDVPHESRKLRWLKRWIWIYFWLLIFEGSLRKWILPSLSAPLLLVRDPIVLIIYFQAFRCGKFTRKAMWPFALLTVGLLLLAIAQIVAGSNTVLIALYGMRSYVLHIPLVIVMAETLTWKDVREYGRWLLLISIPMAALTVAQYYAPDSAWINLGAGVGARQIGAWGGHVRPAGTFSYGSGTQSLAIFTSAFVIYAMSKRNVYPQWLVGSAALATLAAIPILGSRTVVFTMAFVFVFVLIAGLSDTARLARMLGILVILSFFAIVALQLPFVADSIETFSHRWGSDTSEGNVQEVLQLRVLGVFESGFESVGSTPWLGDGIGMGSNAAAVLKTGSQSFLLAEMEWERIVMEFGPIFGLMFLGLRVFCVIYLAQRSLRALRRNNMLPWLLLPVVAPPIIIYTLEQPTNLGFIVLGAGLLLAAARSEKPALDAQELQTR